jgi:hypothetical protein
MEGSWSRKFGSGSCANTEGKYSFIVVFLENGHFKRILTVLFSGPANCAKKGLSAGCPVNPWLSEARYNRKINGVPGLEKCDLFRIKNKGIRDLGHRETAGIVSGRGGDPFIRPLSSRYCKRNPRDASPLLEELPGHGYSLLETGSFEFLHNGFEHRRDVDMLRTFINALPALHAQRCKLGLPKGDSTAQPCSVYEFFFIRVFDHGEVVVFLETQRDIYTRRTGHAVPAVRAADFHQFAVCALLS